MKKGAPDTYFAYDEAGHLVGEYDSTGALVQELVWLGDTPVATIRPGNPTGYVFYYIWTDLLDTPRMITDVSNQARWMWTHDEPFGNSAPNENPASLGAFAFNLRFPGQYYDAETGLHYNYFRDYDPRLGRYVQSDPIGLIAGSNTFTYVEARPLTATDERGLDSWGAYGQGSWNGGAGGASVKFGLGRDSKNQYCFQATTCGRVGPGISGGLTCGIEHSTGNFTEGDSASMGLYGNGGWGPFASWGATMNGKGDVKNSASIGPGGGLALGTQVCTTKTFCINTN